MVRCVTGRLRTSAAASRFWVSVSGVGALRTVYIAMSDAMSPRNGLASSKHTSAEVPGRSVLMTFVGTKSPWQSCMRSLDSFVRKANTAAARALIVSTDTGGSSEILSKGENGLLIPLNDPKSSAKLIYEYCNNLSLQKQHLKNAKIFLNQNFSRIEFEKRILNELSRVYNA